MSKKSNSCILYPEVTTPLGVEASRMYKDFLSKDGLRYPRPFVNLLYAAYTTSDLEAKMEAAVRPDGSLRYKKNRQGQFNAKDIAEFLDLDRHMEEVNNFSEEEYRLGATETLGGKRKDYTDAEEALKKVENFNNTHKMLVAGVQNIDTPTGTIYQIHVYDKNSYTVDLPVTVREKLQAWDIYKQVFNAKGIDITAMPNELNGTFSAYNIGLGNELQNLVSLEPEHIYRNDAMKLFYIDQNSREVKRLVSSFGSIEDAAQALDNLNHGGTLPANQKHLLTMAINHAKQLGGIDLDALNAQIGNMQMASQTSSPEIQLKDEIKKLNKKYHLDKNEIARVNDRIRSLADASAEAIMVLHRKIEEITKQKGRTAEAKQLDELFYKMKKELAYRKHYDGMIKFLEMAAKDIGNIDDMLLNVPKSGTDLEKIFEMTKTLQKIKQIKDQYHNILTALVSDNTTMSEVSSKVDIDNIKQKAKNLKDIFEKNDGVINELADKVVHDFFKVVTQGKMSEVDIRDMTEKALKDINIMDKWFYSMGNAGNIFIAGAGTVVRNAQIARDQVMVSFSKRIDRATSKLQSSGIKNTKFMYEDQKHIVSDIDWTAYDTARKSAIDFFVKTGKKGFDLKEAIEKWEAANTEDRVVDNSGTTRTERVPNSKYRKAEDFMEGWTPEQKEYYHTVLQIKGELETMYPEYGQHWYLPPQVRRNTADALTAGDIGKAIINKVKDTFTVREDDTDYNKTGIVAGENTTYGSGNYDSTVKKQIPIHFQNPVEEGELMLDFSGALAREASSATNYAAMNEIRDTIEFLRDYADSKRGSTPKNADEIVEDKMVRLTKSLYKVGRTSNVAEVLDGFIDQLILGSKKDTDNFIDKHTKLTKFLDNIIQYTSFKGLSTNVPGAFANASMGVMQIMIDAGCGEFFDFKDVGWATTKLFGDTGIVGDAMEYLTYNRSHKAGLFRELFDPMQENFRNAGEKRYCGLFQQLLSHDFAFMGYGSGEYLIHMLPMYAILHNQKVLQNGKKICLYDAFETTPKEDGNSKLVLKAGVTDLDGNPITQEFINKIKGKIREANQTMHGAMNDEDRGQIHRYVLGRLAMNFRQWMVGHYSRRFRGKHWSFSTNDWREGYWVSLWKGLLNDDTKETWQMGQKKDAIWMFMKDFATFMFRGQSQWHNLTDHQKYNIKRAKTEMYMFLSLLGLSFALGDPDRFKKNFWRRWWIYQTKRMLTETQASMPNLSMLSSIITIAQSPIAGVNTMNSLLYILYGLFNGDIMTDIKSGRHKGENKYWRNIVKYDMPFFKDWERLQTMDEDDSLFLVFETSPSNH